jgi:hypothetical protein
MSGEVISIEGRTSRRWSKPLSVSEVLALPPLEWVLPQLIPKGAIALLVAPSGAGKSFIALDMAARIALGIQWGSAKIEAGPVIYVAAEGMGGMRQRMQGLVRQHSLLPGAQLYLERNRPKLHEISEVAAWIAHVRKSLDGIKPRLIIIDTLSKCLAGGDENSAKDMGVVMEALGRIRDEFDTSVLLLHHVGKDSGRGARGHSILHAGVDARLIIVANDTTDGISGLLKAEHQKDAETAKPIAWQLVSTGDLAHVEWIDFAVEMPPKRRRLPKGLGARQMKAIRLLEEQLKKTDSEFKVGLSSIPVVILDPYLDELRKVIDQKPTLVRQVLMKLIETGVVMERDGHVWLP